MIRSRFFFNLILLAPVLWLSCSGGAPKGEQAEEVRATPPSVSDTTEGKLIVRLTDKERNELNIRTVTVTQNIQHYSLQVPGVVFPAQNHISIISTPVDGQIREILIREGEFVRKGQELFRIESLLFGNMVAEYVQAVAEEKFQTSRLERIRQLVEETISSSSELERATSDYQRAMAVSASAVAKLKAIGVPDDEIELFKAGGEIDPSLRIHSPINGRFDQRKAELGQSVNALQELGRVIDLSRVLIKGYLSPDDAIYVATGDSVHIGKRASTPDGIDGVITSVNPGLDEQNRSVVVNVEVDTRNSWPKPGENVRLEIITSTGGRVFAVPLDALTYDGNDPVVFVKKDANTFEKRRIRLSEIRGQNVIVREGIAGNEELAVSQVFSLKALSRYEQIAEE